MTYSDSMSMLAKIFCMFFILKFMQPLIRKFLLNFCVWVILYEKPGIWIFLFGLLIGCMDGYGAYLLTNFLIDRVFPAIAYWISIYDTIDF